MDYPGSHDLTRCNSHDPVISEPAHGSFDERVPFHQFGREQSTTRSLSAPVNAFDPWLLEGPPCGSPLSTSSSINHSESVPTPPYTGMQMYEPVEQPFQHIRDGSTNHVTWTSEPEPMWRPNYPEAHLWGGQQYVLPCHGGPSYEQLPLHPVQSYLPPLGSSSAPPLVGFNEPPPPCSKRRATDSAPFNNEEANGSGADSSDGGDSDSDDSDYDDNNPQKSSHSRSMRSRANASVMKLGPWAPPMNASANTTEPRHYHCHMVEVSSHQRCSSRFLRPEHLSRHIKTVHGSEQPYVCRVPGCNKAFSRGDNLREHYWTHLERGGRVGKNEKMDFLELKAILGPKQKKLARRFKVKLNKHKEKQMKARV
jgi:hypothetical protein